MDVTNRRKFRGLPLVLFTAATALFPLSSHATRVANFYAKGQNIIGQSDGAKNSMIVTDSALHSGCTVTVVNNSQQKQNITYYIQLSWDTDKTGSSGEKHSNPVAGTTVTLEPSGTSNGTNCQGIDSCSLTVTTGDGKNEFSTIADTSASPILAKTQNVTCEGWIKVNDTDTTKVGFVTASGNLTTFTETPPAVDTGSGTDRYSSTTPTNIPIVIQEGRPF